MNCWRKWAAVALTTMCVVGLIRLPQAAIGQSGHPSTLLDELFEKARTPLEEALGDKLAFIPHFQSGSSKEVLATPDAHLDAFLHWHYPNLEGAAQSRTCSIIHQIVGKANIAHHDEGTNIIEVLTDNLSVISSWDEALAEVHSNQFLQLALIHEVVRCHLDSRFHLSKLRAACRDAEEWDALQAIVEGRALAVTRDVASKLGSESVWPLLAKRYLHVPDDAPDAAIKTISQTALHARYRAAMQGIVFFDGLAAAGVRDPEGFVFAHLPQQMTVIAQPACYVDALIKKQPNLAAVLGPLESSLPAAEWQLQRQSWTPAMLAQVAALVEASPERAETVGKTWYEGRSLIWTKRDNFASQVALSVVRHNGTAGARAHFGFAVDLERKQEMQMPNTCGPTLRIIESKSTAPRLSGFDEALRNDKRVSIAGADPIPVSQLLARAGDLVIECTIHGHISDPALAERLVLALQSTVK
jgi:hypothetical protein